MFEGLKLYPGTYMKKMCASSDNKMKSLSVYNASDKCKKPRKIERAMTNRKQDKHIEIEGTSYEPGGY